jgi:predicted TIM-barrel fold metal-dependent hydrolase
MAEKPHSTVATRMSGIREDWLRLTQEEILEPDLAIVDPHHHLWDFPSHRYLLPELLADTNSGHRIEQTVFIECTAMYRADGPPEMRTLGETEFVNGIAAMSASGGYGPTRVAAGIVGLVDLTIGGRAEEILRAHMAAAGPRFKGIRHAAAWEDKAEEIHNSHTNPGPHLYRDHSRFREGFAALGRLGLTFDAWIYHPQIPDLTALARAFPQQPIVLDHVGGPLGLGWYAGRRDEIFAAWKRDIQELARCPNVHMKLGGIGMRINGFKFHHRERPPTSKDLADAWRPYVETCIEAYGPGRCMFESNFPVDKISGSYAVYWNAFKRLASGASAADKAALFRDTARKFYRLP